MADTERPFWRKLCDSTYRSRIPEGTLYLYDAGSCGVAIVFVPRIAGSADEG